MRGQRGCQIAKGRHRVSFDNRHVGEQSLNTEMATQREGCLAILKRATPAHDAARRAHWKVVHVAHDLGGDSVARHETASGGFQSPASMLKGGIVLTDGETRACPAVAETLRGAAVRRIPV